MIKNYDLPLSLFFLYLLMPVQRRVYFLFLSTYVLPGNMPQDKFAFNLGAMFKLGAWCLYGTRFVLIFYLGAMFNLGAWCLDGTRCMHCNIDAFCVRAMRIS